MEPGQWWEPQGSRHTEHRKPFYRLTFYMSPCDTGGGGLLLNYAPCYDDIRGSGEQIHAFLTSGLDGGTWSASYDGRKTLSGATAFRKVGKQLQVSAYSFAITTLRIKVKKIKFTTVIQSIQGAI